MTNLRSQVAWSVLTVIMTISVIAAPMASQAQDFGRYAFCPMAKKMCELKGDRHAASAAKTTASCCDKHAPATPGDREPDSKPCHEGRCSCCVTLYAGGFVLATVTPSGYTLIEPASHKLAIDSLTPLLPGWCEPLRRPPRA